MDDIKIPPEALKAGYASIEKGEPLIYTIRAVLAAWPRMHTEYVPDSVKMRRRIILPVTKENSDG